MRFIVLLLLLIITTSAIAQPTGERSASEIGEAGADVEALIRILENDEARGQLIDKLRTTIAEPGDSSSLVASEQTIVHEIAEYARSAVEGSADLIGTIIRLSGQVVAVVSGATDRKSVV